MAESKYKGGDKLEGWVKSAYEIKDSVKISKYLEFLNRTSEAEKQDEDQSLKREDVMLD